MAKKSTTYTLTRAEKLWLQQQMKQPGTGTSSAITPYTRGNRGIGHWAELGTEDPSNPGRYQWTKKIGDGFAMVNASPSIDSGSAYTAIEASETPGLEGRIVWLRFDGREEGEESRTPVYRFDMGAGEPAEERWFWVTDYEEVGDGQWEYDVEEVYRTGVGYTGWVTKPGGYSGVAYNTREVGNGTGEPYGNGVDSANIPAGMEIKPMPTGRPFKGWFVPGSVPEEEEGPAPATELWFEYENGIDGPCDEPPEEPEE